MDSFNFDRAYYNIIVSNSLTYTQSTCLDVCLGQQIIAQCGCSYLNMISIQPTKPCSTDNDLKCVKQFYLILTQRNQYEMCKKFCPLECNDQNYKLSISSSGYPSDNYVQFLNTTNFKLSKHQDFNSSSIKSDVLGLYIYFEENKYSLVQQNPQYRYWDIFSITGGIVSLFIGFSVLSFFQILDMFFELFMVYWEWRKSKKSSTEEKTETKRKVGFFYDYEFEV